MFKKFLLTLTICLGASIPSFAAPCDGSGTITASDPYTQYSSSSHFIMCLEDDSTVTTYVDDLNVTLEDAYDDFVTTYGFTAPNGGSQITIFISNDVISTTAWASASWIQFSDAMTGDNLYTIPAHELFHTIQDEMFGGGDGELIEGSAHWASDIQDVTDALNSDTYPNNWLGNFWNTDTTRCFSLFWDYMTEQLTTDTDTTDAGFGVGVMRDAFLTMGVIAAREGRDISLETDMSEVLFTLAGGRLTMPQFYRQFLIATYAKEFGNPTLGPVSSYSGLSKRDFVEDEEFTLDDLDLYEDGDRLTSGATLSYDNSGVMYNWSLLTDGFQSYGNAEPHRIALDTGLTTVNFAGSNIDNANIYYAVAVQYTKISDSSTVIREVASLSPTSTRAISLYSGIFSSARYTADYLIVMPFTLDSDPTDGDGNNFSYSVTGS